MQSVTDRRWDLFGAAAGLLLGITDTLLLRASGVAMTISGSDATLLVGLTFTSSIALLGFLVGRLVRARARARRDAETIQRQRSALAESERAALQNEKLAALGRLAAGIAHEVRNPLGVIRASAAMVQEHFPPDAEDHRACGFILEEIDRLDGLIGSLLAFARPAPLQVRPSTVQDWVERASLLAQAKFQQQGVALRQQLEAGSEKLAADPDLLTQALLGLLTNAAEALEAPGTVEIRSRDDGDTLVVEVADDGPGVAADDRDRVFEPFFTTKTRGTGLGLAMAARIVRAHGGELRLVPGAGVGPDGRGACFALHLPRQLEIQGAAA
jgi:two-component system sensor histidine kinase HydH